MIFVFFPSAQQLAKPQNVKAAQTLRMRKNSHQTFGSVRSTKRTSSYGLITHIFCVAANEKRPEKSNTEHKKQPPALELHSELTHRFQWKFCYMQCGPLCRTQCASSNVTAFASIWCGVLNSSLYSRLARSMRRTNESQTKHHIYVVR